ncbi:MAG: V-type ATP synthase subunit D [Candidatus Omnitrophica bacterium]|jgi:V/A-type H+-transporting ATPase subunit D|nr:V-type ATP synthase subunit D [Candidatus Omnitrophota bacterium]
MRASIAATKTNLLRIKKTLSLTEEGYELLDEKRRLLITELTSIIHVVDRFQRELDEALAKAYVLADRATIVVGRQKLEALSMAMDIKSSVAISNRRIMGVNIPAIDLKIIENEPYYSPVGVSFYVDAVVVKFKEILKLISQLAEKRIALLRIAKEVQKTIRKVNALEKIHLPYYRQTLKYINDSLEEEARGAFSMLKLIKERLGR